MMKWVTILLAFVVGCATPIEIPGTENAASDNINNGGNNTNNATNVGNITSVDASMADRSSHDLVGQQDSGSFDAPTQPPPPVDTRPEGDGATIGDGTSDAVGDGTGDATADAAGDAVSPDGLDSGSNPDLSMTD